MNSENTLHERVRFPRSKQEMERRWSLVREAMANADIDMLIMQNDNRYLGGYVRFFIDIPAVQAYPMTVLFEADGTMTTITHGAPQNPLLPEWALRGETERLSSPYIRSLHYTDYYDAKLVVDKLTEKHVKRLGFVGRAQLNHALMSYIVENTAVKLIDCTVMVDNIKCKKSAEELECIVACAKMHDDVMAYAGEIIKPGMREYELQAELIHKLLLAGSEEQLVMIGSAPQNECPAMMYTYYQNRVIQSGDNITLLIECSGPGGYYCEMGRPLCVDGAPNREQQFYFEQSKEVQHRAAELLVPGKTAGEITREVNAMLKKMNLPEERRIFIHGQGYDLIEAPGFDEQDDMVLQENMYVAVHPTYVTPVAFGFCCDNYLVTPTGGRRLEQYEQSIICAGN